MALNESNAPSFSWPRTMKAAQCTDYTADGDYDTVISVQDGVLTPRLGEDDPPSGFRDPMLVRVLSVALAPGDCRVLSGKTRNLQGPPSLPYTPGGDVCGIVVAVPPVDKKGNKCRFKVGDRIAARFMSKPMGMLGEFALVNSAICDVVPEDISNDGAAALVSSGTVAVVLADYIRTGDRVLIIGAGGGVGSHLCQLARLQGASYVAGVGRDPERLTEKPLGCDKALDYTKVDHLSLKEWVDDPFDVIIDLGGGAWPVLASRNVSVCKPSVRHGRYVTITPDDSIFETRSIWPVIKTFLLPALWRAVYSRSGFYRNELPTYSYAMGLPQSGDIVTRTIRLAAEGKLLPVLDPEGPFPFTSEGVRSAFQLQSSRHAKGKVVIQVAGK